jgi:UDP-2,4-diacetamido-2,4,6-trideoxy-beta-L-altropyranose hydrolase
MQIAFRVDASATIGTGHVMRCLTLADALKRQGASCTFIARHLPDYLQELIESKAHENIRIGEHCQAEPCDELSHAHFLGTSQSQDAAQAQTVLAALQPNWLILDHYGIDQRWETLMRPHAKKILVIDDLADRDHNCDLLVDQNLYADMSERYYQRIPTSTKTLLGVQYVMLRSEFSEARKDVRVRKGNLRRLFIFFGGMDSTNFTLPVLNSLAKLKLLGIDVDVVIGAEHPTRDAIQNICREQAYTCHIQTKDMAKLLLEADAAIGAGGSTTWERCCLGLPSLAFIVAPNQRALTVHANQLGLLKAAQADICDSVALSKEIEDFMNEDTERQLMSDACLKAIDAKGTQRIIDQMNLAGIELRGATQGDSKLLFEWRNHPSIRAISINSDPIPWESHQQWFDKVLQDANRPLYIAEQAGTAVGVIRFEIDNTQAVVSLYLAPDKNGRGLGTQLLLLGEQQLLQGRPEILKIVATVLEGNEASHRLFRRCGYQFGDSIYTKIIQI